MITGMRRMIKGKFAQIIVITVVAAVGFAFTIPAIFKNWSSEQWIATVNGKSISYNSFVRKTMEEEERMRKLRAQYGHLADLLMESMGMPSDPKLTALNQLVREELVDQFAKNLDLHIDAEFLSNMLSDTNFLYRELSTLVPPFLIDPRKGIKMAELKVYLSRMGLSISDFYREVENMLKRSLAINLMLGAIHVPSSQIRTRYLQEHALRDFFVLKFDFNTYLDQAKKEAVSEEQLKKFFNKENAEEKRYWIPEKRVGTLWEFDGESYGVKVDDDDIQSYYDDNKQRKYVETPVKLQVRRILIAVEKVEDEKAAEKKAKDARSDVLKNPELFAKKAKEISDDKESAANGGLLPEFSRGKYEREFEKPAFLLKEDRAISEVIRTKAGFEIVQRVKRMPAVIKPLSSVKKEIEKNLMQRKFKDQFYKDMKQSISGYDANPKKVETIITRAKNVRETEPQEKTESKLSKALFRTKKGQYGFYTEGDKAFIVQTTEIKKRYLPALETIKETVKGDFYEQRADKKLDLDLKKAREMAKKKSPTDLKQEFPVTLSSTGMVKPGDANKVKALNQKGFPLNAMFRLEKEGAFGSHRSDSDGFLFFLDKTGEIDQEDFEKKQDGIRKALESESSQQIVEALVAFLQQTATIKVNESIINQGK